MKRNGLSHSRYVARFAAGDADILASQRLRHRAFRGGEGIDCDAFDAICRHVLIENRNTGELVASFRILPISESSGISDSYAAQFYDLSTLASYEGRMVEMGRFCVSPDVCDATVLRVAWAAVTAYVDESGVDLLFGCSSFDGCDAAEYYDAFAMLRDRHLAPRRWLPKVKAPKVFRFARRLRKAPDAKRAILTMPPLLRGYLAMGGWVSDHAVVDHDLGTLHVFTGLEVKAIPPARARIMRRAAC